jgi:hypothetical protein
MWLTVLLILGRNDDKNFGLGEIFSMKNPGQPDSDQLEAQLPEEQIPEYAIGNNEPSPLKYVRMSRLIYPRGPLNKNWILDQMQHFKTVLLIPRGKTYGVRLIDIQSLTAHLDRLAQAPGPARKGGDKGWIR